jgi:3-hydroxyisobutyrate dehydrogenase-like beta-hydroxyacid dehydrogenase
VRTAHAAEWGWCAVRTLRADTYCFDAARNGGRQLSNATTNAATTVGVIGAGRMGLPIIGHIAAKGFPVCVHDIDAGKRVAVEQRGARWAGGLAALAAASEVILVCVGYDRELRELLSDNGLLKDARRGAIIAVLSTVQPRTVRELAEQGKSWSVHVVDSTVCRGGKAADAGTLLSFVGGGADVVARLRPVLAAYSADIVHTGAVGTAQVAKAANNLILWACLVADHEALALAQHYGVDVEALRSALLMSSANNNALQDWGTQSMAWAQDDMAIVAAMADECGISLPQAGVVRDICRTLKPRRYRLDEYGR